jgi:DNA-binding transcriptional LysR family regulator
MGGELNLRQMEAFLAVVEHGGFSSAARATKRTQSTISQHISALESEMGVQLIERSRKGVRLTEAGKILRKHARTLVAELRTTEAAIRRFRGLEQTTLRVGVSTIPGAYLVPGVLARLCEMYPSLDLVVLQGDSSDTVEAVASREVEVGVVGRRFRLSGLGFTEVGEDRIVLVVAPNHPWARRRSLGIADLEEAAFVARESGSGTGATVMEALSAAGVDTKRLRTRAVIGSNETIKAAVKAGIGAAFLSSVAVAPDIERGDLAAVDVDGLAISRPFYLVRRSGRRLTSAASAFWDLVLEAPDRAR